MNIVTLLSLYLLIGACIGLPVLNKSTISNYFLCMFIWPAVVIGVCVKLVQHANKKHNKR